VDLAGLIGFGAYTPVLTGDVFSLDFLAGANESTLTTAGFTFSRTGSGWTEDGVEVASGPRITSGWGLLLEPAQSGSVALIHSDDFTQAGWAETNLIATGSETAPSGASTAFLVADTATNGLHEIGRSTAKATGHSVLNAFAKAGSFSRLKIHDAGMTLSATYLLTGSGSVESTSGAVTTAVIYPLSGGWYRVALLFNNTVATAALRTFRIVNNSSVDSYAGAGDTIRLFRCGITSSSNAGMTTLIPQAGTSTTRNAETCVATRTAVTAGSVLIRARAPVTPNQDSRCVYSLDDGTDANRIALIRDTSKTVSLVVTAASVQTASLSLGTAADNAVFKAALAFATGDIIVKSSLGADQTSAVAVPAGLVKENLGHLTSGSQWGRTIERVDRWTTRRSNSELAAYLGAA
jgi:hypothetical protein